MFHLNLLFKIEIGYLIFTIIGINANLYLKNENFGFLNCIRIFRIKLAINWARIVEKIKIQKKTIFRGHLAVY